MTSYKKKVKELITTFMEANKLSYADIASQFENNGTNMTRQSFWKMVNNGSLKLSVFLEMLDLNKSQLKIQSFDNYDSVKSGFGERITQEINGVVYDTWLCSALSTSFYSDGKNKFTDHKATELYIDLDRDVILLARYCDDEYAKTDDGKKYPWLEIVDSDFCSEYINAYGVL